MTDVELSEKPAEVRADDVSGQETAAEAENNEAAKASESAEAIETAAREASEPEAEPSDENKSKKEKASASETLARAAKASKKVGGDIKKSAVSVFFGLTAFLSDFGAGLWGMLLRGSKKAAAFALRSSFAFMRKASRSSRLIFGRLVSVLRYVGASVWGVFAACFTAVFGTAWNIAAGIFGTVFGWAAKKLKQPLLEIFTFIVTPFAHAWGGVAHAHLRLKKASKRGFIHAVGSVFSSLGRFSGAFLSS